MGLMETFASAFTIGSFVWTRFGSRGRQPGMVLGFRGGSFYLVRRFSVNKKRWNKHLSVLSRGEILGRYDGPKL